MQYHSYWHQFADRTHVDRRLAWLRDAHTTMQPHLGTGGYTNGMDPELADWHARPVSPPGTVASRVPVLMDAIANSGSPSAPQEHELQEEPSASRV